jgi:predicted SAM-dependent methyltransferase
LSSRWRSALVRLKRTEEPAVRLALLRGAGAVHAATTGHVVRRRRVQRYLAGAPDPRLHLGAGPHRLQGWLNSDLVAGPVHLDLARPLPLPDGAFAYVFAEHVIEHLAEQAGAALLVELHRVARPGGVVRLTTPDLRKVIALYEDRNPVVARDDYASYLATQTGKSYEQPCRLFNDYLRLWGHRYVYDEDDLTSKCMAAGFAEVVRREPGESVHAMLRGIEHHGEAPWVNHAEAMCLEATKAPVEAA